MANRVLRDWTDSEKVNGLSANAEVLFTRLFMKADDYGSFHANTKLIKANLFPLRLDSTREADISRWLDECEKAGLVFFYQVDSKPYLRIINFGQRLRTMKKKFPDPPAGNCQQSAADGRELPPETKAKQKQNPETETESETRTREPEIFINEIEQPKDFLKRLNEIEFQNLEKNSMLPPEIFVIAIQKWSLKQIREGWEYSDNPSKDYKMLVAGAQAYFLAWNQNEAKDKQKQETKNLTGSVNGFPNSFSSDFEKKLDGKSLTAYWAHLRRLGLVPKKVHGKTIDWIPKETVQS